MKESIKEKIVGTWKLVSWVYQNEKGETVHYFGKNASGILMYDKSGYMNAQLTKGDRKKFVSDSMGDGCSDEIDNAYKSYAAYYGKYFERRPGEIIHTVEGSLFPNWQGHNEIRYGEIVDDLLVLSTPPIKTGEGEVVFHVTWRRAK